MEWRLGGSGGSAVRQAMTRWSGMRPPVDKRVTAGSTDWSVNLTDEKWLCLNNHSGCRCDQPRGGDLGGTGSASAVINQSIYEATKGRRPLTSLKMQYTVIIVQDNVYNVLKNGASEKQFTNYIKLCHSNHAVSKCKHIRIKWLSVFKNHEFVLDPWSFEFGTCFLVHLVCVQALSDSFEFIGAI